MAEKSNEEKTEKPTPKRVKELRKKNTVLRSQEVNQTVGLVAVIVVSPILIIGMWNTGLAVLRRALSRSGELDVTEAVQLFGQSVLDFFYTVAPPVLVVLLAVAIAGLALTRGKPNPYAIKPRPSLLNPKQGVKRVLGVQGLIEATKGLVKLTAVVVAAWTVLPAAYSVLLEGPPSIGDFLAELGGFAWTLVWRLAAVGIVVAMFDLWWQRRQYNKQSKMSLTEVKREYKSSEGDPMQKAARRQRQAQMSRQRMMDDVPSATVVLTNPTHISIALRYEEGDFAPVIVARGAGVLAAKIKQKAFEAGVPVHENVPLARSLYKACRVGDIIPVDLYAAVAAVLAAVMKSRRRKVTR
jgi:flagellar biosynthetic protein FlhB